MSWDIPGLLRPGTLGSVATSTGLLQDIPGLSQDVPGYLRPGTLSLVLPPTRCLGRPRMYMNVLASEIQTWESPWQSWTYLTRTCVHVAISLSSVQMKIQGTYMYTYVHVLWYILYTYCCTYTCIVVHIHIVVHIMG